MDPPTPTPMCTMETQRSRLWWPVRWKRVGNADGSRRPGEFDSDKKRLVIDNGVGEQPFVIPLIAQVPGGSVVQHARGAHAS